MPFFRLRVSIQPVTYRLNLVASLFILILGLKIYVRTSTVIRACIRHEGDTLGT